MDYFLDSWVRWAWMRGERELTLKWSYNELQDAKTNFTGGQWRKEDIARRIIFFLEHQQWEHHKNFLVFTRGIVCSWMMMWS